MEINDLGKYAVILLTVTVVIGLMITVLSNMQTSTKTETTGVLNESHTGVAANATVSLNNNDVQTLLGIANGTGAGNFRIGSANYTFNAADGQVTFLNANYSGKTLFFNYTYYTKTLGYNTSQSGISSLNQLGSNLPTLAIVLVAAIIIGIVIAYFKFNA